MMSLTQFFNNKNHLDEFLSILNTKSRISLRVIDWFTTNFSRDHDVAYTSSKPTDSGNRDETETSPFIVHDSYKSQLKAYSKKQFDPFCRRSRINFFYGPSKKIVTTVGQMNFFRWFIENKILSFIEKNIDEIEKKMREYVKNTKQSKKSRKKEKKETSGGSSSSSSIINQNSVSVSEIATTAIVEETVSVPATSNSKRRSNGASSGSVTKHNLKMVLYFQ